jgi:hypothetical protein
MAPVPGRTLPVTASPAPEPARPRLRLAEVDLTFVTVLAIAWLAAVAATLVTLWLLIGVVGNA